MGNKVKVNALASIVGIVLGGTLAGVEGMFVSIPTLAVLKILFDKSETLRPWGVLLGEESTPKNQSTTLAVIKSWRKKKDN
jgi:predicted PurR-regulated permease PerM